jgi:hypothetical protein
MNQVFASNLVKYFELIAGLIGVLVYYKDKKTIWFILAVFLIVLFGMEYTGYWLGKTERYKQNTILYKYLVIPSLFCMYHFIFYHLLPNHKINVLVSLATFIVVVFFENLLLSKEHYFTVSTSLSYGCLAVSVGAIMYLLNLVKTDAILDFKKNMGFWVSIGLLLFYVGSFVRFTFGNSLGFNSNNSITAILNWTFLILNYIMYTLFAIGFICSKPK